LVVSREKKKTRVQKGKGSFKEEDSVRKRNMPTIHLPCSKEKGTPVFFPKRATPKKASRRERKRRLKGKGAAGKKEGKSAAEEKPICPWHNTRAILNRLPATARGGKSASRRKKAENKLSNRDIRETKIAALRFRKPPKQLSGKKP